MRNPLTCALALAVAPMMAVHQSWTTSVGVATDRSAFKASAATAIVRIDNVAGVRSDLLQVAENRAGDVYHKISAHMTWVDTTTATRQHIVAMFTLVLVNVEQSRGTDWIARDALGFASPPVSRAWVFWDRIEAAKARAPATALVLGDVMAHELGHLILSSSEHSLRGIMRAEVPMQMRATETFTKSQAQNILSRLQDIRTENYSSK